MELRIDDMLRCIKHHGNIKIGDKISIKSIHYHDDNTIVINGYWFYRAPNQLTNSFCWYDECFVNLSELKRSRNMKLNKLKLCQTDFQKQ